MSDPRYDIASLLKRTGEISGAFLASLPTRRVGARDTAAAIEERLDIPLPEASEDPKAVIEHLARDFDAGLVATAGPRYFGFVIGGALPAAVAADWLTAAWGQNAALHVM